MKGSKRAISGLGLIEVVIISAVIVCGAYLVKSIYKRTAADTGAGVPQYGEVLKELKAGIAKIADRGYPADAE